MSIDHTKNIIEVRNVSFRYGTTVILDAITCDIHAGDYLGLIGPNGGGKTTLIKIILGLLQPFQGDVLLFGIPVRHFHEWSRVGYVSQKASHIDPLFPATVHEVVAMGRYGVKGLFRTLTHSDTILIDEALQKVGMEEHSSRRIGDLSPGQQQRVFIARALAAQPQIIILDEPTVGIDSTAQEQFYTLLEKLNRDFGITLILASHDIDAVAREATELACINQSLVYHGIPETFFKDDTLGKMYGKNVRRILHNH
jgi:zinc transport system ATP-binding protein